MEDVSYYTLTLIQQAKGKGGDKYSTTNDANIYVVQEISRKDGKPYETLYMTLSVEEHVTSNPAFVLCLDQQAKKSGGDRYYVDTDLFEMKVYVPQSISRDGTKARDNLHMTLGPSSI